MKRLILFILCVVTPFTQGRVGRKPSGESPEKDYIRRLREDLDSVLPSRKFSQMGIGVMVYSMDKGEFLYSREPDTLLIPASVAKVVTAYVALKRLKPTFAFKTQILSNGTIRSGLLSGDLYLRGFGDPSLVSERMWMLVNDFMRAGVRQVQGDLVADASFFDSENRPSSRPTYLRDQAYNSPIGGLSFNFNTTTIFVRPGSEPGEVPIVYSDPENSYIDIVNQAKTSGSGSRNTLAVNRTDYVRGDIGDTVLLRGNIPIDSKEMRFYRNIVNPALYTAHMFKTFLEQRGIKMQGKVVEGITPSGTKLLVDFDSLPLWQIVWGMNKFSNNFVADQILKRVGAEAFGAPGSLSKGMQAIQEALEDIGFPRNSYEMVDGSGLTRKTRLTARQILTILTTAYRDFSISAEFAASLGIAGEDGTLRNRIPSAAKQNPVRAKTGTLDGVSSLAGFTTSSEGEMLAFCILLNDPKGKYGKLSQYVDRLATAVSRFARKSS